MTHTIKLYNKLRETNITHKVKKVDVGTLPYQLAYKKFLLSNGFSLNQTFSNSGKLSLLFDEMYNY